jgi:hypothetical protein
MNTLGMGKSLGDYNIEKSSSFDINNIKWSQKNPIDTEKSKNKKKASKNTSSSNIIYAQKTKKVESFVEKVFKVKSIVEPEKSKNKKNPIDKKFQNSSAANCKIQQGFIRPAR